MSPKQLEAFADIIDADLVITRYGNQAGRWTCSFRSADVKKGSLLGGLYGEGKSPLEAMKTYAGLIAGELLVFNAAGGERRREYRVPA